MTANAVNASAPVQAAGDLLVIRLCLLTDGAVLAIECWDQAPGVPVLHAASGLSETGRGLAIIDSLTGGAWGCQPAIGQAGKCVWAEIPVRDVPASPLRASAVPKHGQRRDQGLSARQENGYRVTPAALAETALSRAAIPAQLP